MFFDFVGITRGLVINAGAKIKDAGDWIKIHSVSFSCNTNLSSVRFRDGPLISDTIIYEIAADAAIGTELNIAYLGLEFKNGLYIEFNGAGLNYVNMTVEG